MSQSSAYHSSFEPLRSTQVPSLNIEVREFSHTATSARHIHLQANDSNNAFLVAFLTVPQDSTGVAHILEHTSLCGSRRFPVRDPFFMMTRRSLNTFMNAFTSSDWTAYPFASQNPKDFDNLLQVYLDAVFYPRLDELDFAQEGHRLEFEVPDDPTTELVYRGVVYNEMKGAMSSPVQTLWQREHRHLFPSITYHNNSGGEPENIPDLTYDQLQTFHARHYHPSNAVFMTYGDFPVERHQERIHELALRNFERRDTSDLRVPDERRYRAPIRAREVYALDAEQGSAGKTYVLVSWLLGRCFVQRELMNARLLEGVLLDNSSSPLRLALETSPLGTAPSELCGLDDSTREMGFFAGLEGSEEDRADAVEELVLDTLRDAVDKGIDAGQIASVLHQMELGQREITGGGFPYGLNLMVRALTPSIHGGDLVQALDIDPVLESLRRDVEDPDFVPGLIRTVLLDNPHRVRLVMAPDQELARRSAAREVARLHAIKLGLDDEQRQRIAERAAALQVRQQAEDDAEILPRVELADVPPTLQIAQGWRGNLGSVPTTWYPQGTNGMVYQQIVVDLPHFDDELVDLLPFFCTCLAEVGCGDMDYVAAQARQAAVTGGVGARLSVRARVDDVTATKGAFVLSGKALTRNAEGLAEVLRTTFERPRFDDLNRLRELIAQQRAYAEANVTDRGHALAMTAACAEMSPVARLSHRWSGLAGIRALKTLDDSFAEESKLATFSSRLEKIASMLLESPMQMLLVGEPQRFVETTSALEKHWGGWGTLPEGRSRFAVRVDGEQIHDAWLIGSQINFCAKAYQSVAADHPDAATLVVLAGLLRNGYLHRAIREQGGAYGGGAGYDSDSGAFRFFSYRDPRLAETLQDFDRSIDWLHSGAPTARECEEAILGVVAAIDRPDSPAGEAVGAYYASLHGRTPEQRRRTRARVLEVTLEDMRRVAERYLQPEGANVVVLTGVDRAVADADLGLRVLTL